MKASATNCTQRLGINWSDGLESLVSIEIEEGQKYFTHVDTVQQTAGDYRLVLIPKSDGRATGQARVDLNFNLVTGSQSLAMNAAQASGSMMTAWPMPNPGGSHDSLFVA